MGGNEAWWSLFLQITRQKAHIVQLVGVTLWIQSVLAQLLDFNNDGDDDDWR